MSFVELGPKTLALLAEHEATRTIGAVIPCLDETYRAGDLPPHSVVRCGTTEYVVGRSGMCMLWEQPIPGSEDRLGVYVGRLADGDWMTPRQRAEVDAVKRPGDGT